MRQLSVVDSHLHILDPDRIIYPWLERRRDLKKPYSLEDYRGAIGDAPVKRIVLIEAAARDEDALSEAHFMSEAAADPLAGAIVAQARLERGRAVEDELAMLAAIPRVTGIRRVVRAPFRSDPSFCVRPLFIDGVRSLARYDLSFDIACASGDLPNVIEMVSRCEDVRFVLNHLGNPPMTAEAFDRWWRDLRRLAKWQNVSCKISGLPNYLPQGWTVADARPYVMEGVEAFGFDRVMFGSDYPVHNGAGGFLHWFATIETLFQDCTEMERAKFFNANARKVYRIDT